jgi:hypothetical protein
MGWQDAPLVDLSQPSDEKKPAAGGKPAARKPNWMAAPLIGAGGAPKPPSYGERVEAAGKKMDRQIGTGVSGVLKGAVATAEVAEEILTTPLADIAGAATSVVTQDPKKGTTVKGWIQTHPATSYGQATSNYLATIAEPLSKMLGVPKEKLEKSGHPILAQVYEAAVDLASVETVGTAVKGAKRIGTAATKAMPVTSAQKLSKLAGKGEQFRDTVRSIQADAQQAEADMQKFAPVKDPRTGKFTRQGPAFVAAQAKAEATKVAADAISDRNLYGKMFSENVADIDSVKESMGRLGSHAPIFVDETIRQMGETTMGDFSAVQFVRKYKSMPIETKRTVFAGVKGDQYMRDMNALVADIEHINGMAKRGKINMPPGLHHLDFTRTDIIVASLVAAGGVKLGVPHMLAFGVGLYMGKPIERLFKDPRTIHILRNTADTTLATAGETGRLAFGMSIMADDRGEDKSAVPEPYDKRHGIVQR